MNHNNVTKKSKQTSIGKSIEHNASIYRQTFCTLGITEAEILHIFHYAEWNSVTKWANM